MRYLTISLIFGIIHINNAYIRQDKIIGNWSVIKVHTEQKIPAEQQQTAAMVERAFLRSEFHFKPDNRFEFDFEYPEMKIKNGHWKFGNNSDTIIIQNWKDRKTSDSKLMVIVVKEEKQKTLFKISESFFVLEMKKD
jgi:hypothetical protein